MLANVVLAAALVSTVSAHLPAIAKREFLENRQEQDLDESCVSAINDVMPLYESLPIPSDDLLSITLPADPCATPELTGSLSSEYSSYTSELMDWYSSNSAALSSAMAECTSLADYESELPVCSSAAAAASATTTEAGKTTAAPGSSSAGPSSTSGFTTATTTSGASASTGTASSSSSSSTTIATANAAPRETGYIMVGAAAAAGLIGVVAAL